MLATLNGEAAEGTGPQGVGVLILCWYFLFKTKLRKTELKGDGFPVMGLQTFKEGKKSRCQ